MTLRAATVWIAVLGCLACAPVATAGPGCAEITAPVQLGRVLGETSGVAVSVRNAGIFWTHNDGDSDLYALDRGGSIVGRFDVGDPLTDWEDLAVSGCGEGRTCLYLADTGDNAERRPPGGARIVRVSEPVLGTEDEPLRRDVFPFTLPDGPRDIEAIFVLPGERVHVVTKGGSDPITLYRYPGALRPDTVTLVEVQRLTDGSAPLLDRVTGASASADGSWVAIRTYQTLRFYHPEGDGLRESEGGLVNLRPLGEIQGEAVGIGPDGLVVLTSEGGPLGGPPSMRLLRCRLERDQ